MIYGDDFLTFELKTYFLSCYGKFTYWGKLSDTVQNVTVGTTQDMQPMAWVMQPVTFVMTILTTGNNILSARLSRHS
jgi:hypothetical protein